MLGLADRGAASSISSTTSCAATSPAALARLKGLYEVGADPAVVLEDLAAFTHLVTRLKLAPAAVEDDRADRGGDDARRGVRRRSSRFACSPAPGRCCSRASKKFAKQARAARRGRHGARPLAHAADLPTPDEALRTLGKDGGPRASRAARHDRAVAAEGGDGGRRLTAAGGAARRGPQPRPSEHRRSRWRRPARRASTTSSRSPGEARPEAEARAGECRPRRSVSSRAGSSSALTDDAPTRVSPMSCRPARGMDRPALDGRGRPRRRPADHRRGETRGRGRSSSTTPAPTRWSPPCSTAFPARRSSMCG